MLPSSFTSLTPTNRELLELARRRLPFPDEDDALTEFELLDVIIPRSELSEPLVPTRFDFLSMVRVSCASWVGDDDDRGVVVVVFGWMMVVG